MVGIPNEQQCCMMHPLGIGADQIHVCPISELPVKSLWPRRPLMVSGHKIWYLVHNNLISQRNFLLICHLLASLEYQFPQDCAYYWVLLWLIPPWMGVPWPRVDAPWVGAPWTVTSLNLLVPLEPILIGIISHGAHILRVSLSRGTDTPCWWAVNSCPLVLGLVIQRIFCWWGILVLYEPTCLLTNCDSRNIL